MTVSDQQAMDRIDSILNNAGCKDDIAALDKSEKVEERRRDEAAWRIQTWWRHVSSLRRSEKKEQVRLHVQNNFKMVMLVVLFRN